MYLSLRHLAPRGNCEYLPVDPDSNNSRSRNMDTLYCSLMRTESQDTRDKENLQQTVAPLDTTRRE